MQTNSSAPQPCSPKPTPSVTRRPSEPPTLPHSRYATGARRSHGLTQTETDGRRRTPTRTQPKQAPSVSHLLPPSAPQPASIPASKGRKRQPELLWVLQCLARPRGSGGASPYTPVWGAVVLISQALSTRKPKTGCPQELWLPLPGSVQGQVGWGFEQPGLVEGVPVHGGGVGTR